MPGNKAPARQHSRAGATEHKYKKLRNEYQAFKLKVANYQGAVHELGKSATISAKRVGTLANALLACRKHFAKEPHYEDCSVRHPQNDIPIPCNCGHAAILESIDNALKEPDWDPGNVKVEIKDDTEVPSEMADHSADLPPSV